MKKYSSFIIHHSFTVILILSILIIPIVSQAQILPACTATGNCGICDFIDTFINILQWVLGLVAGLALVFMVWHGFSWLTAAGSSEKIESGKKGITHAILGMLIVLAGWQIVNIIIVILVNPPDGISRNLFNGSEAWHEYCSLGNTCIGKSIGSPCGNGSFCKNSGDDLTCGTEEAQVFNGSGYGTISAPNACAFWASYPEAGIGGNNPYKNYDCRTEENCNPYENLGTAYCPQTNNTPKQHCCSSK